MIRPKKPGIENRIDVHEAYKLGYSSRRFGVSRFVRQLSASQVQNAKRNSDRRSFPERRSAALDRRSPCARIFFSDRLSMPERRS